MERGDSVVSARAGRNAAAYPGGVPGLLAGAVVTAAAGAAWAGPEGEQVVQGQASFQRQGDLTVIHAGNNAVINYRSFDIAAHEKVQFVQPDALSRVLNRINSAAPTRIDGALSANGRVYIVNPAGVMFGKGSVIDVARLFAAGGNLADADFLKHVDRFTDLNGAVVNHGTITADAVGLLGASVANHGTIVAERGAVMMAAGDEVFIGEQGGHLFAKVSSGAAGGAAPAGETPGVENTGTVTARRVSMSSGDLFSVAIRNKGTVKAAKIDVEGGKKGTVEIGGKLDAAAAGPGERGGEVRVLGERVVVKGEIDASGPAGGGVVLAGGSVRGAGPERGSGATIVAPGAVIRADATAAGPGGTVAVWSDGATGFYGSISAEGASGGAGGFVETSGKGVLDMRGRVRAGNGGTWLLDPRNVTIDDAGASSGGAFGGGNPDTFTPTADDAVVDSGEINSTLNSGTSVVITTSDAAGMQDGNVTQTAAGVIEKTVPNAASFTILASGTITLNGGINTSPAGKAMNVTLTANDAAQAGQDPAPAAGDVVINAAVNTRGGSFTSTGVGFTGAASITSSGGAVSIDHTGSVGLTAALSAAVGNIDIRATGPGSTITLGSTLATTAGDITLNSSGTTTLTSLGDVATTIGSVTFGDVLTGAVSTGGDITTSGGDVRFNRAVTLTGPVAIGTNAGVGSGTVTFAQTVDGPHNLSVVSGTASTRFEGPVGSIAAVGSGTGAAISLGGTSGPVQFDSTVATASGIVSSGGSAVTFTGDVTAGNGDTASSFSSDVVLDGLTFAAADGARFGDAPGTDRVTLSGGAVALTGGAYTFDSAVDGAQNLTVNSGSAATAFNGVVGGVTPIGSGAGPAITLATSGGTTTFAGTVSTAGPISAVGPVVFRDNVTVTGSGISTFDGNVTLDGLVFSAPGLRLGAVAGSNTVTLSGGPVSLTTTAVGVQVEASVDGAQNLTVNAATGADFKRAVGASTPIGTGTGAAIDISGAATRFRSTVQTAGPLVSAVGLEFRDDVTVGGTGTSTIDGDVTFDKAGLLTFTAPAARLGTAAGSDTLTILNGPLTLTTTGTLAVEADVTGAQDLTAAAAGGATFKRAVSVGDGTGPSLTVGTGGARFDSTVMTADRVSASGDVEFRDDVMISGSGVSGFDGDVIFNKAGPLAFTAPGVRLGAVSGGSTLSLAAGPVTLTSTALGIQVEATVDGAQDLTLNAATLADFRRAVGSVTPIGTGAGGSTAVTINGGGALFRSTLATSERVTASSFTEFRGAATIGGAGLSTLNANVIINNTSVSAAGGLTVGDAAADQLTLQGAAVTIGTSNAPLVFNSKVDGGAVLTTGSGTGSTTFNAAVGSATRAGGLTATVAGPGVFTANSTLSTTGAVALGGTGDKVLKGAVTSDGGFTSNGGLFNNTGAPITTIDSPIAIGHAGAVTLAGALSSGAGNITIGSEVQTTQTAAVTSTTGDITYGATRMGGLVISANTTSAGGSITMNRAVTLAGPVTISSPSGGGGPITFGSTVNGPFDLAVNAGPSGVTFIGAVGGVTRIGDGVGAALTLLSTGQTEFVSTLSTASGMSAAGLVTLRDTVSLGDGDFRTNLAGGAVLDGLSFTAADGATFGDDPGADAVVLSGGPVSLASTGGGFTFLAPVNGAQNLTVDSGAATTLFGGAVGQGTPVGTGTGPAITLNSTGVTTFASSVGAASGIDADGPVAFVGDVALGNGDTATVLRGDVTLGRPGGMTFLASDGAVFGDAATDQVTITGGAVTILSTPGSGPFTFNAKVDSDVSGPEALEINAGTGAVRLGGTAPAGGVGAAVGGVRPLASLKITGSPITITADVTTIGVQEYIGGLKLGGDLASAEPFSFDGPVTLLADTSVLSGGDVTFAQTVATDEAAGAPRALRVETTGTQSTIGFAGAVGGGAGGALASLTTVNSGGVTTFGGGAVTTTGAQDYTGRVLLQSGMVYTGSSVRFGGAVASGSPPAALSVSAAGGPVVFGGAVGDAAGGLLPLASLTVQSGSTAINGGGVRTAGDQQYNSPVTLGADAVLQSSGGNIALGSTLDGAHELTISAPVGTTTFGGDVGGLTPLGGGTPQTPVVIDSSVVFAGAGPRVLRSTDGVRLGTAGQNHAITFTPGGLTIDAAAGGGPVDLNGPVNGAGPLTVAAGSGAVSVAGAVGAVTAPSSLSITGGSIGVGAVTTAGPQTYAGPATLSGNLVATGPGAIAINGSAVLAGNVGIQTLGAAGSDGVTISGGVQAATPQGAPNLSINAGAGPVVLGGTVGPSAALAPGSLAVVGSSISLPAVTTLGTQTYTGATTLGGNIAAGGLTSFVGPATLAASVTVSAGGSPVSFLGTLTGPHDLTVSAGAINLGGDVALGDGVTSTPIALNGAVSFLAAGGQVFTAPDGATFGVAGANQAIQLAGGGVTVSSGAGGGSFRFNGPVNGAAPLSVSAGGGSAVFTAPAGGVTPLSSLTVTAAAIDAVGVSTAGAQAYNGAMSFRGNYTATGGASTITLAGPGTLTGDASLGTAGGGVSFNSTLDGGHDLVVNSGAGPVMFAGSIGSAAAGGPGGGPSITLNSTGPAEFTGTVNTGAGITAAGPVTFREDVSTGNGNNLPNLFRGETTLDGMNFTAADGVIFAGEVLVGGSATSVNATQPDVGRVVFRRGLNAMPGTAPDVTISSGVVRTPDGAGSASPALLSQPAIQLGPVGTAAPLGSLTLGGDIGVVPKEGTILLANDRNGDGIIQNGEINESDVFEINTTGDFRMGQNQKLTALGNVTVNAGGDVALSDMNSLGSININAGAGREIRLLKRERTPGGIYDTTGSSSAQLSSDLGLDFVAAGDINFSSSPTGVTATEVDFATNSGNRGQGMEQFPVRIFSDGVSRRLVVANGSDSPSAAVLSLDLRAQGPTETNIASSLAGALPRTDEGPEPFAAAISESLKAKLEQMGIFVKEMRLDEVIEFLVGRTVYRDVPQRTRPESGDYRISARRLPADSVEQVVLKYLLLRDKPALDETGTPMRDEKGNPLKIEQWENIRDTFATAWAEFMQDTEGGEGGAAPDGAAFRGWLESKYGADPAASEDEGAKALGYLEQLRDLFKGLDSMGLSPQEVKFPKNKIVGDVTPPDMDAAEMERAILGPAVARPLSQTPAR